jgi:hypothetical protein
MNMLIMKKGNNEGKNIPQLSLFFIYIFCHMLKGNLDTTKNGYSKEI